MFRPFLIRRFIIPLLLLLVTLSSSLITWSQDSRLLSRAFEVRYFTGNSEANGETDFRGETEIFSTDQRIEFLKYYADYATRFFNDPNLDKPVLSKEEVNASVRSLKPQPLPQVRKKIPLENWKFTGYKVGQREDDVYNISNWTDRKGVQLKDGYLLFIGKRVNFTIPVKRQDWRLSLQWDAYIPAEGTLPVRFMPDEAIETGISKDGNYYFVSGGNTITAGPAVTGRWVNFRIELDFETGRYNWFIDEELVADFVKLSKPLDVISVFSLEAGRGLQIDNIRGTGYQMTYEPEGNNNSRDVPFSIDTYIDEDFEVRPDITGWNQPDYDDSGWLKVPHWPYAHGGERYKDEYLYLRKVIPVGSFGRAELNVEKIYPSGEIWVNGKVVEVRQNTHPFTVDLTDYIIPDSDNLIAIKVNPNKVRYTMRHTPSDEYIGWFAGRIWLELKDKRRIGDIFVSTELLEGESATLGLEIGIQNDLVLYPEERERKGSNSFEGSLRVSLYKWFPEESNEPLVTSVFPLYVYLGQNLKWTGTLHVPYPDLWTPENPVLHKLVAELIDNEGNIIDDQVVTTGIRTISQEGGTFRINGVPSMMNGAMIFGFRSPLEHIAQWLRRAPLEKLVEDILMLKKMNANTARMSVHDGPAVGTNDPRYAEIGDQLGILFQWQTTSWIRTDSPYLLDFEGLPKYVRQVRNHPSIAMWQPANHPYFRNFDDFIPWLEDVYDNITSQDRSRLISPTASMSGARVQPRNDEGTLDFKGKPVNPIKVWTAPLITRGNMDFATGYTLNWSTLRMYPYPLTWSGIQNWQETGYRMDYLNSKKRAYFDFESEESTGQPNWKLHRGKPQYLIQSYELGYDNGRLGRMLSTDEWMQSQAYQAMSAYEAYRKKRWLDYDGLAWCTLRGGGNTGTYQKPLIDYYGHAKLAFYTVKMSFQPTIAGSNNVDIAYGPEDLVTPVVIHLGPAKIVDIIIKVKSIEGKIVDETFYQGIELAGGRSTTTLESWKPSVPADGHYALDYEVYEK